MSLHHHGSLDHGVLEQPEDQFVAGPVWLFSVFLPSTEASDFYPPQVGDSGGLFQCECCSPKHG